MIGLLDFGPAGNIMSVANAFRRAGAEARIVKRYDDGLRGLVIPGVGSFSVVPQITRALGGKKAVREIEVPVLCICLGMQAMLEGSEECKSAAGLGLIDGNARKLRGNVRLPQLGWNAVRQVREDELFDGIKDGEYFYFANSYAAYPRERQAVVGTTEYGKEFASAVRKNNWRGVQFHPEKSGKAGQRMIRNFAGICTGWRK